MLKSYVWSTLLYSCETWVLKSASIAKLLAFESWCVRRMLKIKWTDRLTNNEVFRRVNYQTQLINNIKKRCVGYFGHIMRGDKYELLKLMICGKLEGWVSRGRKRTTWISNIKKWTGFNTFASMKNAIVIRDHWKNVVANIL